MKPPASIESDEARRPTTEEEDRPRRTAACATDGDGRFVGSCETEEREAASPQEGQKREPAGISAEQLEQRITLGGIVPQGPGDA